MLLHLIERKYFLCDLNKEKNWSRFVNLLVVVVDYMNMNI